VGLHNKVIFFTLAQSTSPKSIIKKNKGNYRNKEGVNSLHFLGGFQTPLSNSSSSDSGSLLCSRSCFGHLNSDLKPRPVFLTNICIPGPQFSSRIISFVKTGDVKCCAPMHGRAWSKRGQYPIIWLLDKPTVLHLHLVSSCSCRRSIFIRPE
jgi:hypothetical protein